MASHVTGHDNIALASHDLQGMNLAGRPLMHACDEQAAMICE